MKPFGMTRQSAGTLAVAAISLSLLLLYGTRALSDDAVETIVLVRHGEKPDKGLGQLDCQGLNRALALPPVIAKTFGRPSAVFAPYPSQRREDDGVFLRLRPTPRDDRAHCDIFRAAGQCELRGLHTDGLRAWEHRLIETIARVLLAAHGGDPALVPKWDKDDFDSMYVVTITGTGDAAKVTFSHGREGLDGQPNACPR